MLRNYITVGLRNLLQSKTYSLINLLGLATGIACCLVIFFYVQDERSYDRYHERADRIYRIAFSTEEDKQPSNANGSFGVGPAVQKDFPEVERVVRFRKMGQGAKIMVGHGQKRFYEEWFFFADASVFDVFSFRLVQGNPQKALLEPNSLVITQSAARRYFGAENPVGQTMVADPYNDGKLLPFRVTGVLQDVPANSHFTFDFLASFSSQRENLLQWSGFGQIFTYVLLKPDADAAALGRKLTNYSERYMGDDAWYSVSLQPLTDIYLRSALKSEVAPTSNYQRVYLFAGIGVIILLIACINFMNLATARSARRAKEVGVRKTLGAGRRQLIAQFTGETLVFSTLAAVLAVGLIALMQPVIRQLTGKPFALAQLTDASTVLVLPAVVLGVALLAGSYPSLFLSAFQPKEVLKGTLSRRGSAGAIRKVLVVFQFFISTCLIVATLVVYRQMQLVRAKSLAGSGEQVMVLPLNHDIRPRLEAFKSELARIPGVTMAAGSSLVPARGTDSWSYRVGDREEDMYTYKVDHDFLRTMNFRIVAGRDFDRAFATDTAGAFIINRRAVQDLGIKSPAEAIGKEISFWNGKGRIVGVVENFHVYSLRDTVASAALFVGKPASYNYLSLKVKPEQLAGNIPQISKRWSQFSPNYPLEYYFLDESFERLHQKDLNTGNAITAFAALAVFISCLGLFGLTAYTAEQRTKEISIRKILGASGRSIVALLSRDFLQLVLLSLLLAVPTAGYLMQQWLRGFAYRVSVSGWLFVLAGGIALLIAALTVSFQAVKAALANPVDSLRNE